jgi:hypothetical protein
MYQLVYDQQVTLHPTKPPDLNPHSKAQWTSLSISTNLPTSTTAHNIHQHC